MSELLQARAANWLTGLRVALTPAFMVLVWTAPGHPPRGLAAAGMFMVIAASDIWDGRLARHYRHESATGRLFDHFADAGFLLGALYTYMSLSLAPWWVPAAIAASFAFYCVDSWSRSAGHGLIGSRLGHLAGICNYALVGILVFDQTAGIHLLPASTWRLVFWLVPLYSAAAVVSRAFRGAGSQAPASAFGIVRR